MTDRPQDFTPDEWLGEYRALTAGAGLVDFSDRTIVELSGSDRSTFLHNLSTNEIRKLTPGSGCEVFLTNVQGKILAHGYVFADEESLKFETVPGQAQKVLAHLDRYLIREKVTIHDAADRAELLLSGPESAELLRRVGAASLPTARLTSVWTALAQMPVAIRQVDFCGPVGFLIEGRRADLPAIGDLLIQSGAVSCRPAAFEAGRIEAGTPLYGVDVSEKNLPQEVGRDQHAISFVKGCYLGQETVARIDALGHVNRMLVGVRFAGSQPPPAEAELHDAERAVGNVTSATYSPRLGTALALAYVRRGSHTAGTRLESSSGPAEVVALPVH